MLLSFTQIFFILKHKITRPPIPQAKVKSGKLLSHPYLYHFGLALKHFTGTNLLILLLFFLFFFQMRSSRMSERTTKRLQVRRCRTPTEQKLSAYVIHRYCEWVQTRINEWKEGRIEELVALIGKITATDRQTDRFPNPSWRAWSQKPAVTFINRRTEVVVFLYVCSLSLMIEGTKPPSWTLFIYQLGFRKKQNKTLITVGSF